MFSRQQGQTAGCVLCRGRRYFRLPCSSELSPACHESFGASLPSCGEQRVKVFSPRSPYWLCSLPVAKIQRASRVLLKFTWFSVVKFHEASEEHTKKQAEINAHRAPQRKSGC